MHENRKAGSRQSDVIIIISTSMKTGRQAAGRVMS
jgi:hypothetical protein